MSDTLLSVGLDVGTTSTQMILSELTVENRGTGFTVPELTIAQRKIRYQSPVYFTPLLGHDRVDGEGIRKIVAAEYEKAGIRREDVRTGAVIITGETSRKENARAVLSALSELAGDFVVATAGPHLESILAAKGAGATEFSESTGKTVLHMDIGGGTSNLALIKDGKVMSTSCLNVGGRLLKFDPDGRVTYVSPVLEGLCSLSVGDVATLEGVEAVAETLTQALEMAAGLCQPTPLLDKLSTKEAGAAKPIEEAGLVISFSGGVADCIETVHPWLEFGDIGPVLGQAIRKSRLCAGEFRLGSHTIRATVIGAGCHSAQLSGSTVFCRNLQFPMKNLPVAAISLEEQELPELSALVKKRLSQQDSHCVLAMPGFSAPSYSQVTTIAQALVDGFAGKPVLVALEQDMAKALGQAMALGLPQDAPVLCIDRVKLHEGSYLDVGAPIGPALPVVIKTLVLGS